MNKIDKINEYIRGQLVPGENIIGMTQASRVPPTLLVVVCSLLLIPGIVLGLIAFAVLSSVYGSVYLVATDQRLFVVHSNFNASMVWVKETIAYATVARVAVTPVAPKRKLEVVHAGGTARLELKGNASGVDPVAAQRFLQEYPGYLEATVAQIRANPQHPAHRVAALQPTAQPKKLSTGVAGYVLAAIGIVAAVTFGVRVGSSLDEAAQARTRFAALEARVATARAAQDATDRERAADDARIGVFAAQYRPESDPIRQRSSDASVAYMGAEMDLASAQGQATQGELHARDNGVFASIALGFGVIVGLIQWARNRRIRARIAAAGAPPHLAAPGFAPQPR